jgi:hypothetical protein
VLVHWFELINVISFELSDADDAGFKQGQTDFGIMAEMKPAANSCPSTPQLSAYR